eukprot:756182-Hanusia_phi.AAC.1
MLWQNARMSVDSSDQENWNGDSDVPTDSAQRGSTQSYQDTHSSNSFEHEDSDMTTSDFRSRCSEVEDSCRWDQVSKGDGGEGAKTSEEIQAQKANSDQSPEDRRALDAASVDEDIECRICRGGVECGVLLYPCRCSGSIRYVHQECLDAWLARTGSTKCELCHQPFIFSPVYAPNAPERLSPYEFTAGLLDVIFKKLIWYLRLVGAIVADWMQGVLLSLLVVTVFLAVSALRDYMLRQERLHQHIHNRQQHRNPAPNRLNMGPPVPPLEAEYEQGADDMLDEGRNEEFDVRDENINFNQEVNRNFNQEVNINFNQEVNRNFPLREMENQELANDDALVGFLDGREEIPLEEFIGINGPLPLIIENFFTVLISNAIFIGMLTFVPFSIGRSILWFKHNWKVFFDITFTEKEAETAYYGDGVTLLTGYATVIFILLDVVLVSMVSGTRQEWFSPQSPLHRQVLSMTRYALILIKESPMRVVVGLLFPTVDRGDEGRQVGVHAAQLLYLSIPVRTVRTCARGNDKLYSHWAVGVAFMVHVAVLVAVLREVVKPEVLWFLRNPEDAIEHPLRDLIDEPIPKHARRIVLCTILYVPLTVILIHLPLALVDLVQILQPPCGSSPVHSLAPHFLSTPYGNVRSARFLQGQQRVASPTLLRAWLEAVGSALGIQDRVLPAEQSEGSGARAQEQAQDRVYDQAQDPASSHNQPPEAGSAQEDQSHEREKKSILKETMLMLYLACLSIALVGGFSVIVPLLVGRQILAVLGVNNCNDMYAYSIGFATT